MANTETRPGMTWISCGRCSGTGHYGGTVQGGKCFACLDDTGRPTGGEWIPNAVAVRRAAAAKRRDAKRKAADSARLATFAARNDATIAALAAVGFTNVRDLMHSTDARTSYAAQDAMFAVRDRGDDPAEVYAAWKTNNPEGTR